MSYKYNDIKHDKFHYIVLLSYICKQEVIILSTHYYLFIIIYKETYHVNKGVLVSISNTAYIITQALAKSYNNNNTTNNNNNIERCISGYNRG